MSMPNEAGKPTEPVDLKTLLMRLMDGALTPDDTVKLTEALRNDAGARARYHDLIETHALLHWEHDQPDEMLSLQAFDHPLIIADEQQPARTSGSPILGFLGGTLSWGHGVASGIGLPVLTLGAMLLGGLLTAFLMLRLPAVDETSETPRFAAKLGRTINCEWRDENLHLLQDAGFSPGRCLDLESGLVKILFADGSRVILEGPARFRIDSMSSGFLEVGRLTSRVPKEAVGFKIGTPSADVIDLGTEFGVMVDKTGAAEVHVLTGEVKITRSDNRVSTVLLPSLKKRQAARFEQNEEPQQTKSRNIECKPAQFVCSTEFSKRAKDATVGNISAPKGSFSIVVISDMQEYRGQGTAAEPGSSDVVSNSVFESYCRWVANNLDRHRIVFVSHVGDMTNKEMPSQWRVASDCMDRLHGRVPYGLVVGLDNSVTDPSYSLLVRYFPYSQFEDFDWFGGIYHNQKKPLDPPCISNSYQLFSAQGLDFITLHIRSNPTDDMLRWANGVLTEHADRRAIILTDAYLGPREKPLTEDDWFDAPKGRIRWAKRNAPVLNDAEQVWSKCFSKHRNVFMICCADDRRTQTMHRVVRGEHGNPVNELLADYGPHGLRVYNFRPDDNSIQVNTYSPFLKRLCDQTKVVPTRNRHQFILDYDMSSRRTKNGQ